MDRQHVTLSQDQKYLLEYLLAAVAAGPAVSSFHCGRLMRVPFAWIIHANMLQDVRVAHWDDVLVLNSRGLINLSAGDDDSDECTFELTELAYQVYEQWQSGSRAPCKLFRPADDQDARTL